MMEIVTVSLPYSVTILIIYRHYLLEGNLPVKIPFCSFIIYDRNFTISSSTVLIPPIPNCSINTFLTFGERKAGSVGPK